jgi:RNA methyltransferase, TrmH family
VTPPIPLEIEPWLALRDDPSERERRGCFLAEGTRFLHAAFEAGVTPLGVMVAPDIVRDASVACLLERCAHDGIPTRTISPENAGTLSILGDPSGLAFVAPLKYSSLFAPFKPRCLWLGFDAIQSPGNLGTMLRTAVAAGATGACFFRGGADPYDPRCVRATMGAVFSLRLARVDAIDIEAWRRRVSGRILGADGHCAVDYRSVSLRKATMLMLGCERGGLTGRQRAVCDGMISIPMSSGVDSLNVAAAAAVLLYEARRQRTA